MVHAIDGGCDWSDIGSSVPDTADAGFAAKYGEKGADGNHGACGAGVVGEVGGGDRWHAIICAAANDWKKAYSDAELDRQHYKRREVQGLPRNATRSSSREIDAAADRSTDIHRRQSGERQDVLL